MSIIKNEPIYPFNEGDYTHPHHIIVQGSYEEIGFDLATLAKKDYGSKLGVYDHPVYAEARPDYLATNWPQMLERTKGVLRAYGLPENDVVYDATTLPYDWYDEVLGAHGVDTCSAAVLPIEKSMNGATFVSRNFDLSAMVLWSEAQGKKPPVGAHNCWSRGVVLETRPDKGYKTILVGGQELLIPYIDGINENGLYMSLFHDPWAIGDESSPTGGMSISGVTVVQAVGMLLETCATVEEAKQKILNNRIMNVIMCAHSIIADAAGNATIFEIDGGSGAYIFTDRQANEPLFITNHPVSRFPEPSTYPEFNASAEHNTFQRQIILRDAYAGLKPPFKKADATAMTDAVHCAFIDDKKAEAGTNERTLINTTADLSKPEISVRWYLGDVGPIAGTNHMKDRISDYYTFGF